MNELAVLLQVQIVFYTRGLEDWNQTKSICLLSIETALWAKVPPLSLSHSHTRTRAKNIVCGTVGRDVHKVNMTAGAVVLKRD